MSASRYIVEFDIGLCVGCGACAVACMDQWDLNIEATPPFRTVCSREYFKNGKPALDFLSVSCMHCEDAPCARICPKKCFSEWNGLVLLDNENCIKCHQCNTVCPVSAIGYGEDGKATKCNGCSERLELGLPPACVRACQNGAITYGEASDGSRERQKDNISALSAAWKTAKNLNNWGKLSK